MRLMLVLSALKRRDVYAKELKSGTECDDVLSELLTDLGLK